MKKIHWLYKLEKEGKKSLYGVKRKTNPDAWGTDTQSPHQFFYELIANADDEGATKIKLIVDNNKMIFQHNGKPFTKEDVDNITSYKKRKKHDKLDKIGNFGSGFKTVHQFCNEPEIYTLIDDELIGFKIKEKIIPSPIKISKKEEKDIINEFKKDGHTKFVFYFNNKKSSEEQLLDIKSFKVFLNKKNEEFLLFLPNIKEIIFKIENSSFAFKKDINKIDENLYGVSLLNKKKSNKFFYLYSEKFSLPGYEKKNKATISVAYKYNKNTNKFLQVNHDKNLFVTFRTQENFEYRFCINAPFRMTESRVSVREGISENKNVLKQCEEIIVNSILNLKKNKILNISFFDLLPLEKDKINKRFESIKNRIMSMGHEEEIWPVNKAREFLSIDNIIFGENEYKKNFSNDDLQNFNITKKWLDGPLTKRIKELLKCLTTEHFNTKTLQQYLDWNSILENKNEKKLFSIYKLLQLKLDQSDLVEFSVIKAEDGNFYKGRELRFPTTNQNQQNDIKFIFKKLISNKKTEEIKFFFTKFGVKEIDIDDIINISHRTLKLNFDSKIGINIEEYEEFLEKLISSKTNIDADLHPLLIDENNICRKSYELYIDDTSYPTRLGNIYEKFSKVGKNKYKIYFPKKIDNRIYLGFLNKLNVQKELKLKEQDEIKNRNILSKFYTRYDQPTGRSIATLTDYWIDDLESIITSNMTMEKSLFIRDALNEGIKDYNDISKSTYKRTKTSRTYSEESSLIFFLKKKEWIPDINNKFRMAKDLSEDKINKNFYENINSQWLEWLNFNQKDSTKNEEKKILNKYLTDAEWAMNNREKLDKLISEAKAKDEFESKQTPKSKKFGKSHREVLGDDIKMEDHFDDKDFIKKRNITNNIHRKNYKEEEIQSVKSKYAYHCQICHVEGYESNSYSEHTENRRKMSEDAHIVKNSDGGPAIHGNLLSLCVYHHHYHGDKITPNMILESIKLDGSKWKSGIIHKLKFLDGDTIDIYFRQEHKDQIIKYLSEHENKKIVNFFPNKK